MFIWGEKEVRKHLGFVADFCPLCRDLRTFEVCRLGIAGHIYYITFVEGRFAGFRMTCQGCRTEFDCEVETYATVSKAALPADRLVSPTFPDWREKRAAQLAIARLLADPFAKIAPAKRHELIRAPFRLLAPRVEKRFGQAFTMDGITLATFVGAFVAFYLAFEWHKQSEFALRDEALAAVVVLAMAAVVAQIWLGRARYFRREIFPILVPALKPLKPTRDELQAVVEELKALRMMIARKVDVARLVRALAAAPASAPASVWRSVDDSESQEIEMRLDLAKAYAEMGDTAGAAEILREVLSYPGATEDQKSRARQGLQ